MSNYSTRNMWVTTLSVVKDVLMIPFINSYIEIKILISPSLNAFCLKIKHANDFQLADSDSS